MSEDMLEDADFSMREAEREPNYIEEEQESDHSIQVGWGIGTSEEGPIGVVNLVVDDIPISMNASRAYQLGMMLISTGEIANTMAAVMCVANGHYEIDSEFFMKDVVEILQSKNA